MNHDTLILSVAPATLGVITRPLLGCVKKCTSLGRPEQLMGKVKALSHLGGLHRGVRRRIIRRSIAADGDVAQHLEWQ